MLFLVVLNIFTTSIKHGLVRMNNHQFNPISREFLSKYFLAVLLAVVSIPALAVDTDGDGLTDDDETNIYGTDPNLADTDGDGLTDGEEVNTYNTQPNNTDTDGDGLTDGAEIANSADPLVTDTDSDGLTDGEEVNTYNDNPTIPTQMVMD